MITYQFLRGCMDCDYFYSNVTLEELSTVLVDKWYVDQNGTMVLGVNVEQPQLASKQVL